MALTIGGGSSSLPAWQLKHPNGQTAGCAILVQGSRYRVQRWLNGFVSGADDFEREDHALQRAAAIHSHFERRGFRDDWQSDRS